MGASKPGPDFVSAVSRVVHEARNYLRLVACSVAASSTEAQGVQEGLSQVRELRGPGAAAGPRRSPASGHSCPWPSPSTWCGWEGSDPQRSSEVGMEKEWKALLVIPD